MGLSVTLLQEEMAAMTIWKKDAAKKIQDYRAELNVLKVQVGDLVVAK